MNKDLVKGAIILAAVLAVLVAGAFLLSDNGWRKVSCVGRAVVSGVSFANLHSVCGL